jgi:hypothetical protein
MKRNLRWIIPAIVIGLVVTAFYWAKSALGPEPQALQALQSDSTVQVTQNPDWITFSPTNSTPTTGFVFYPGGRVDYRSYAVPLRKIAAQGYQVVLVQMPLSLAVLAPDRADEVISAYPDIQHWVIGGHSLGGAMAAQYIYNNPGKMDGLVFWAAYPASNNSLVGQNRLQVALIHGTLDGLATPDKIEASEPLLPNDTKWIAIDGGNHAQFGDYGVQPGDGTATISTQEQQSQGVAGTLEILNIVQGNSK